MQREKQRLLKDKVGLLEKVRKFRKKINKRLDKLENNSIADIEDKYKALIAKLEEGIKMLDVNTANVKSAQDKVGSPGNNVSQEFVNAKKGKNMASNAAQCIEHNKEHIHTEEIDFTPDQKIPELLGEINLLGKITQTKLEATGSTAASNIQLLAKGRRKYNVQVQSDKRYCNIVSACTLEDGTIILSDHNNKQQKRLDSSTFTVTDFCNLPGQPWQVCPISKREVAVCLYSKKVVQFIAVGTSLTKSNQINTDFECYGLAYCNGNLFISDSNTSVYIYSISGSKLRLLSKNQPGQTLFFDIRSLAVSQDSSKIYVCDYYKGLIILGKNGMIVGKYNGSKLDEGADCYLTATGSLLVCGGYSDNVLQFGQNGDLINEVVKFTEKHASHQAICCNQQMSKMIIGRNENEIEVYDLVK